MIIKSELKVVNSEDQKRGYDNQNWTESRQQWVKL